MFALGRIFLLILEDFFFFLDPPTTFFEFTILANKRNGLPDSSNNFLTVSLANAILRVFKESLMKIA